MQQLLLTKRRSLRSRKYFMISNISDLVLNEFCDLIDRMGAKVQTENTKLNVPGAGTYEFNSKVSKERDLPGNLQTSSCIFTFFCLDCGKSWKIYGEEIGTITTPRKARTRPRRLQC